MMETKRLILRPWQESDAESILQTILAVLMPVNIVAFSAYASIQVVIIASFGLAKGSFSDVVNHSVSLDDLFK